MKKIGILPVLLIGAALSGCGTIGFHFRNMFVNNYDGAGHFTTLVQSDGGTLTFVDSLDAEKGFDMVCVLRVKIFDISTRGNLWKDVKGRPELHYCLPEAYIDSSKEAREDIKWRGDLARYYKDYVNGLWRDGNYGKYYDAISVVGVTSEIGTMILRNVYVRFWGDRWMAIPLDVEFAVDPGSIFYLGTLIVDLDANSQGEIVGASRLRVLEGDRYWDMSYMEEHFPLLFVEMGNRFVMP